MFFVSDSPFLNNLGGRGGGGGGEREGRGVPCSWRES